MGNASALMKSEDWAALITDARARNCFMEMDSLPQDFPLPKVPSYDPKAPNGRGFRSGGPRIRSFDAQIESSSGTTPEDNEKLNTSTLARNDHFQKDRSMDDFGMSGDRYRDALQHGNQRKQNFGRDLARQD